MRGSCGRVSRAGIAVPMVLALLFVVFAFGGLLRLLASSAYHEVETIDSHLRAITVGEMAFGTTMARLTALPWSQRWFARAPQLQAEVPAAGGVYTALIQDTPSPVPLTDPLDGGAPGAPAQADLLVRATYGRSTVTLFWRLTAREDSLEPLAVVIPTFFTFAPEGVTPTPGQANLLSQQVDRLIGLRRQNAPGWVLQAAQLNQAPDAPGIAKALGISPGPILSGVPPPDAAGPLQPDPPPAAGGPPVPLPSFPPPSPSFAGNWLGNPVNVNGTPGRDHLVITQQVSPAGVVTVHGVTSLEDDAGNVLNGWEFVADVRGNQLGPFTVNHTVGNLTAYLPSSASLTMDPAGQTISGPMAAVAGGGGQMFYSRGP